jgi:hypothetical protein
MDYRPTEVSRLLLRGLMNQLGMEDVDQLVRKQFPDIDGYTLWESYNITLAAFASSAADKSLSIASSPVPSRLSGV